jgi:hypothetical protein
VRKFLITALVAGSLGVAGAFAAAPAKAVSSCTTGGAPSGTGGTASVGLPVGCVQASGDAASQSGYAQVDGNGTIPGPVGGGYLAVDGSDGGPTLLGCASGEYDPGAGTQYDSDTTQGNNVIASQAHPPGAPEGECSPSVP